MAGSPILSVNFANRKNSAVLNYHKSWSWSKSLRFSSLLELKYISTLSCRRYWWNKLGSRRELTRRDFSRQFSAEAAWKVKMLWRQTSPVTPCFELDSTKTWCRNPTKPAGLIRITIRITIWIMIVQNGWIFSICEIYWEYGTAGHLVFWKPWPAVELKKFLSVTKHDFLLWAQRKPNTRLEGCKAVQDRLTFLNRHMTVL